MLDLWQDGVIDCKDYALRNAQIVRKINETPVFVLTPKENPKHIFVIFNRGEFTYVLDNDRAYRVPKGLHKGIGIDLEAYRP